MAGSSVAPSREEMLEAVQEYIARRRQEAGIIARDLALTPRPEGSCCAEGEFKNMVESQLMYTRQGCGAWRDLAYDDILEGAWRYVAYGETGY